MTLICAKIILILPQVVFKTTSYVVYITPHKMEMQEYITNILFIETAVFRML